ncbi:hypothetical protein, partial [Erwinia billingiae]|uniref:hypothetical protein n=1 Tax=Erwinia billingiae TaxID=182337 RepID=UPI001A7EA65E
DAIWFTLTAPPFSVSLTSKTPDFSADFSDFIKRCFSRDPLRAGVRRMFGVMIKFCINYGRNIFPGR